LSYEQNIIEWPKNKFQFSLLYKQILHRCSDQTGLCETLETCAAIETQELQLIFFVQYFNDFHKLSSKRSTELKKMTNHTKCGCIKKSNLHIINEEEIMSSPLALNKNNNNSKVSNILLIFMTLFSIVVIFIAFIFLYRKCRQTHRIVAVFN
jgi:hypothetical protein